MPRFTYSFELLPGTIEDYDREHANIWPRVVEAMKRAGITDYSLFRRDHSVTAVGTCARSVAETFAALDDDPDNRMWSAQIRTLMHNPLDEHGQLRLAEEVWRMP